jgi:formylglycine-generating enzyme required for sulfatase activity
MGSPSDELGRESDEAIHTVVLTKDYLIEDHEVTQDEYEAVMHTNPSRHVGAVRPVENVTWFDAITYCNARSALATLTPAYAINGETVVWDRGADGYRLLTEAEWERSCRAGSTTAFATGPITSETCEIDPVLDAVGWYCGNAGPGTHAVMTRLPNAWNLYDMHGNVWEYCWDWYAIASDPISGDGGPATGMQRVIRGGSWYYYARECRSASRAPYWPNSKDDIVGFRVARTIR